MDMNVRNNYAVIRPTARSSDSVEQKRTAWGHQFVEM